MDERAGSRSARAATIAPVSATQNERTARDFLRMALVDGEPERAVELYAGPTYVQHSPGLADGIGPFIEFAKSLHADHPELRLEFARTIAADDLVVLHTRVLGFGDAEHAAADFYRFDDSGPIVEAWEDIQPVPAETANDNGMF